MHCNAFHQTRISVCVLGWHLPQEATLTKRGVADLLARRRSSRVHRPWATVIRMCIVLWGHWCIPNHTYCIMKHISSFEHAQGLSGRAWPIPTWYLYGGVETSTERWFEGEFNTRPREKPRPTVHSTPSRWLLARCWSTTSVWICLQMPPHEDHTCG